MMTEWNQIPDTCRNNEGPFKLALSLGSAVAQWLLRSTLLVLLVGLGTPLRAAEAAGAGPDPVSSAVQGIVTAASPSGEATPLVGIEVKLTKDSPGQSLTVLADENGHYGFDHLPGGTYRLQVGLQGFEPFDKTIPLGQGEVHVENVALHLAAVVEKVEVHEQATSVSTESTTPTAKLVDRQFQALPMAEQKFKEALPLVPGVVRSPDGTLNIKGQAENQSMLLVDSAQTVDPVTGNFSIPVPIDAIQNVQVEKTPYDTEYGRFSGGLTTIETKPPSAQWKYGLMDFIPGVRGRAGHIVGLSSETPRVFFGGPLIPNKLNFSEAATYDYRSVPVRGLAWPHNETRTEGFDSLSSLQAMLSPQHVLSLNVNGFSTRVRYADINALVPQPASSDDGNHGVSIGANDGYQFRSGALLSTLFQYTRFDSNSHGEGPSAMLIMPEGWGGNFFNAWTRTTDQFELLPIYRLPTKQWWGRHELKLGADFTHRSYHVARSSHPLELLRQDGSLAEEIGFAGMAGEFPAHDSEVSEFVQDHWMLNQRLALDLGGRFSTQSKGRSAAFAPRGGLVYSPGEDHKTIIRAGGGRFYDRVPLLLADLADDPTREVTLFDPHGIPLGPPTPYPASFVQQVQGGGWVATSPKLDTSPRNISANLEIDRELARSLVLRTTYVYSQTQDLYLATPLTLASSSVLGLANRGGSHYHEIETTLRYRPTEKDELNVSYVRSRSRGDLNTLSSLFGSFDQPVIRPNFDGTFTSDVPNRLVGWGIFSLPWKLTMSPVADVRTGFPYSNIDTLQNYVGIPNNQRFPTFFSLDLKLYREIRVSSLPLLGHFKNQKLRLGVYALNLTNHSNYLDVYNNITSPYFGHFAGFQHRVSGLVIDMVH